MKFCKKCKVEKPLADFYKHKHSKDGHQALCKVCHKEKNSEWAKNNPEAKAAMYKRHSLKKNYGMTPEGFRALIEQQNGCCDICNEPFKYECKNGINVDHNHETGEVRGLLCNNCNPLLGNARDRIDILEKAIQYLTENGTYGRPSTRSP